MSALPRAITHHSSNLKSIKRVEALDAQKKGRVTMRKEKKKESNFIQEMSFYKRSRHCNSAGTLRCCTMKLIKNVGNVP